MTSFADQLPALIGVLLGAGATFGATFATDRARWHRDQSVRWDVKRADVYAEYAFAVKRVISLAVRVAAHRGAHSLGEPLSPDEGIGLLAEAEHERAVNWETVLLLGSDNVVKAGRRWQQSVFPLEEIARGRRVAAEWDATVVVVSHERGRFYEAARNDLGLQKGSAPGIYDWQFLETANASGGTRVPPASEPPSPEPAA
jgi:hypothetical protein